MAGRLHFSLVSPEREVFSGDVDQVDAPGSEGDFGVLAGHAPFMTTLKEGFVYLYDQGSKRAFAIKGGFGATEVNMLNGARLTLPCTDRLVTQAIGRGTTMPVMSR